MADSFILYLALYSIITFFIGLVVGYTMGRKDEYESIIRNIISHNLRTIIDKRGNKK